MNIRTFPKVLILTTRICLPLVLRNNNFSNAHNFRLTRDKNAGPKTIEYISFWLIYILIWCNLCIFWIDGNNLKTAHSKMVFWDSLQKTLRYSCLNGYKGFDGLHSKFFYLSTLPRITLPLAVNFMWGVARLDISLFVIHGNIITGIPSLFLSVIFFFIFLMTAIHSTNDQNIVTVERSELTLLLILCFHE